MHGVGTDTPRQRENPGDIQVALGRRRRSQKVRLVGDAHVARAGIGLGIHRQRGHSHAPRGARDAADNFAAIGDEEPAEHARAHIRNTPKRVAGVACAAVKARANPSTRRVSSGSMTPSSQRRADA